MEWNDSFNKKYNHDCQFLVHPGVLILYQYSFGNSAKVPLVRTLICQLESIGPHLDSGLFSLAYHDGNTRVGGAQIDADNISSITGFVPTGQGTVGKATQRRSCPVGTAVLGQPLTTGAAQ